MANWAHKTDANGRYFICQPAYPGAVYTECAFCGEHFSIYDEKLCPAIQYYDSENSGYTLRPSSIQIPISGRL